MPSLQAQAEAIADRYTQVKAASDAPALNYHTAKRFGRPTTITPELIDAIASLTAEGHYVETACAACGVPERTYYHWLERGKEHVKQGIESPEADFWQSIKGFAEPWGEIELIRDAKSGRMGWQGPMTVASRRHRARWQDKESESNGPRILVQIGVAQGEVSVGLAFAPTDAQSVLLSPTEANVDGGCNSLQSQAFANLSSPITALMVTNADACHAQSGAGEQQLPAGESLGGPYPGEAAAGGQRSLSPVKGRVPAGRKKKAPLVRKAQEQA